MDVKDQASGVVLEWAAGVTGVVRVEDVAIAPLELSVVLPCLNESDTVAACVAAAQDAIVLARVRAEVIVADNASEDGSGELARRAGARVIPVARRGYGSALMEGIAAASGRYIVIADADGSYDLGELPTFLTKLREGNDLVQGCRLGAGGGRLQPGAMPWLHRWCGNPLFSLLARWWFGTPLNDVFCGMRGLTRELYDRLDLRATGMEFAAEMVVKASLYRARMIEVPITLYRDGRRTHASHLRTWRDGWRTLRFFLMCCPHWLFLIPGQVLIALGLIGYGVALPGLKIGKVTFDAHTLVFASLALLCGSQSIVFGVCAHTFAATEGLAPPDAALNWVYRRLSLERGLVLGMGAIAAGVLLLVAAIFQWWRVDFGNLDYAYTMRSVVPGATLTALGLQTVLASFFLGILRMGRK